MVAENSGKKIAVIAGAGPAGLTCALELLRTTDVKPVIFEAEDVIGGISRTARYNGNRMDIGGHRFFSKNDEVNAMWQELMPLQGKPSIDDLTLGVEKPLSEGGPDPETEDRVMLLRNRISRIFFLRKFFAKPVEAIAASLPDIVPKNSDTRAIATIIAPQVTINQMRSSIVKSAKPFFPS